MKRTSKKKLIPDFRSEKEEAEFWDTHDTEDFIWEECDPPRLRPEVLGRIRATKGEVMKPFSVRLPDSVLETIRRIAIRSDRPSTWLARRWILQGIRKEENRFSDNPQ